MNESKWREFAGCACTKNLIKKYRIVVNILLNLYVVYTLDVHMIVFSNFSEFKKEEIKKSKHFVVVVFYMNLNFFDSLKAVLLILLFIFLPLVLRAIWE